MPSLAILDIAVGLIFVFLIMSLLATAVREAVEQRLKSRAVHLHRGIRELLNDRDGNGLTKQLYEHPMVYSLFAGKYEAITSGEGQPSFGAKGGDMPSYIPARNFAAALIDLAGRGFTAPSSDGSAAGAAAAITAAAANDERFRAPLTLDAVRKSLGNIQDLRVQRVLLNAIDSANGDLTKAQENIAAWYDGSMDRVSGWYKRQSQRFIFWFALGTTVVCNVNALTIAEQLSKDATLRNLLVAEAEVIARDSAALTRQADIRQRYDQLEKLGLPIGWKNMAFAPPFSDRAARIDIVTWLRDWIFWSVFGWLLTAFAVSLGAPFWFDILNKVMVIRATVKPREKSPDEGSEDRKPPRTAATTPPDAGQPSAAAPGVTPATKPVATTAGRAADDPDFEPHEWKNRSDPDEGVI
jgi:hypothetical protein